MFTLWYSILSYKEYRDVIFASTIPAPPNLAPASDIKPLNPITPTPPETPAPPRKVPAPSVVPLIPPSKLPRSPSPHPMIRSDILDDIAFEDDDLLDDDEEKPIMAKKAPYGNVSTFLQEEIRSGGGGGPAAVQTKLEISRAR